jgi:hypothetical protein
MKWSRHRDHARRKQVRSVNVQVGRVECAELQHKVDATRLGTTLTVEKGTGKQELMGTESHGQ